MEKNRERIRRLMIAINKIDELYYELLKKLVIKDNSFVLFYAIADGKGYSQKKICEEWSIPRTTLNTTVQEYVKKGYIYLEATGHKEKIIMLTDKGKDYIDKKMKKLFLAEEKVMSKFLDNLLINQMEEFAELLKDEFIKINKVEKGEKEK